MNVKKIMLCVIIACMSLSPAFAIEWHAPGNVAGQDSNWYNTLNWSTGLLPIAGEATTWRYASSNAGYHPIVISGGTAVSGAATCGIWYPGTASITVTNAATYSITGGLNMQINPADASKSPANIDFNVNGGSTVNVSGEAQVGRKLTVGTGFGVCTINLDGAGTTLNQGNMMWFGWGVDRTCQTRMNITNGAVANFNVTGGLRFQPDTTNGVYPVVNLAGGFINIKGDRRGEVSGWIANNYLIAYEDEGSIVYGYDTVSGYTNISSSAPVPPVIPPVVSGLFITAFLDNFDSYSTDTMWCGDPIILAKPNVGMQWTNNGVYSFGAVWDCDFGVNDSNSLKIYRPDQANTIDVYAYPKPLMIHSKGFTYRFEHDVYIPTGGQARFFIYCDAKNIGYWAYNTFRIADGVNPAIDTGKAVPFDQWVHIRADVYEDNKVWIWYTPEGGQEQLMAADLTWNIGYGAAGTGMPMRSHVDGVSWGTPAVYFDNYKATLIDNTPQGYPVITPAASAITIDGVVDLNNEWAAAKKVAFKPAGSKGHFKPVMPAGWHQGLTDATTVDVYMSYDDEYAYIAFDGTNMTSGVSPFTSNGRTEAVFTFDTQDVSPTVSYVYTTYAAAASSAIDSTGTQVQKSVGYQAAEFMTYGDFTTAGGLMKYTVTAGRIQSEFRIPLAFMPEFTGIEAGSKLNVQFNYVETPTGDHRATTNSIGCFIPDLSYGAGQRYAPLAAGVTFPVAGDFNGDCAINSDDLAAFAQYWLVDNSVADLNDDGNTDYEDFAQLGTNWLVEGLCD